MILAFVSATLRVLLILIIVRLITRLERVLSWREKTGAGIMGGSGFLTLAVILDVHKEGTPFDVWAGLLFSLGASLFFWGFMDRKLGHERRNDEAKEQARLHLAGRGKL
jgi:hypothetical protein